MDQLRGRVAVITGGASGIGLATAEALGRKGMKIVLADKEAAALDSAVPRVEKTGAEVIAVTADAGELAQVQSLCDRTIEHFGAVHVVFSNAGVALSGPMYQHTHEEWEWIVRVNLWGVIHGVEVFVPKILEQGEGGHVVNTASFAGVVPNFGLGAYCVTKYGVVALSECLQRDLRSQNVGVSVLCPMRVSTNIGANSARDHPGAAPEPPAPVSPAVSPRPPEGRTLPASEVADLVVNAIERNELYVFTHEEARQFVRRRFERMDRAFESLSD